MTEEKKGPDKGENKGKDVEKLTDGSLDKVSGGKKIHIIVNEKGEQRGTDGKVGVCRPFDYRR